ncbi:MAG: glycoside hydrolase family 26 protein, partial [Phycisphaerae bacterium]
MTRANDRPRRSDRVLASRASRYRRAIIAPPLLVAAVLVVATFVARDGHAVRRVPLDWGIYQILWSRQFPDQLAREVARFASKPHYVMFYRDLGRPFPKAAVEGIERIGAVAIVSLELWSWHGGVKGSYLPLIAKGDYDGFLRSWATAAKTHGRRVLLRFGFEFNGNWFTWGGDPEGLVTAWRRAHDIFRKVGADNVEWVWSPNVVSVPDKPGNDMHRYYPGDQFVDWVGVDGYNFGENHDRWHRWQTFDEVFDGVLTDFKKRYSNKPVMLTEFGCAPGPGDQRERWIRDAFA